METYILTYKAYGENALLIEWPAKIEEAILYDIIKLQKVLEDQLPEVISECIPAYQSLTIFFDPENITYNALVLKVKQLYKNETKHKAVQPKLWHIPVCYDPFFGIDQDKISHFTNLPTAKLIEIHASTLYTIYFIGFLPGFLYLGGLPQELHIPRKSSPSATIPKGSVAIGGNQTGIYPQENPGGWHVIGNSPLSFLDTSNHPPVFSDAGDKVKFVPIDLNEHEKIGKLIKEGTYSLNMEIYNK